MTTTTASTATTATLIEACLDKIRSHGNVTFVELAKVIRANSVDPSGPFEIAAGSDPNVILWSNMSAQFCDVMDALQGLTQRRSTSYLTYMCDGGLLQLPIAKKPPKSGYREPHWAPVVFNVKAGA